MKSKFLLVFFIAVCLWSAAQQEDLPVLEPLGSRKEAHAERVTDSLLRAHATTQSTLYPKKFKIGLESRYQGPDFDYTVVKPRQSFMEKLTAKIVQYLTTIFGKVDVDRADFWITLILKVLAVVGSGFLLYLIVRFLVNKEDSYFFTKKNRKLTVSSQDLVENIHEINFPQTIADLESKQDYRSAVRYHFLAVLKLLSDQKLISWNAEKTNQDYLAELANKDQQLQFQKVTYIFDNVWYGEFEVDLQHYQKLKSEFLKFQGVF